MFNGQSERDGALDQIKLWTSFSQIFADAFPVERYHGLQWFFVEILLDGFEKELTVGDYQAIVKGMNLGENPNYYVPAMLSELRRVGRIEITRKLGRGNKFIVVEPAPDKPTKKQREAAIPQESDRVGFRLEFSTAIIDYVRAVFKALSKPVPQDLDALQARQAIQAIYDFFMDDYLPIWRRLLRTLSRKSVEGTNKSAKIIESRLRDNSAIYIFLHAFWESYIRIPTEKVPRTKALRFCDRIRDFDQSELDDELKTLAEWSGILLKENDGKRATYIFNKTFQPIMLSYMAELLACTSRLGAVLESYRSPHPQST